ncbi:MAG: hypothetical protein GYB65_10825 [Chloroflexi bacterium]|nr:hypothetical protein [Chloroflexota bacterium]
MSTPSTASPAVSRPRILIGHHPEDRFAAETLALRLGELGYTPVLDLPAPDETTSDGDSADTTFAGVDACLLLLTPASLGTSPIEQTIHAAQAHNCPVIALLIQPCAPPPDLAPPVDFTQDFNAAWDTLRQRLPGNPVPPAPVMGSSTSRFGTASSAPAAPAGPTASVSPFAMAQKDILKLHLGPEERRVITTTLGASAALDAGRTFLTQAGFKPQSTRTPDAAALTYIRGGSWRASFAVAPKCIRTTVTLAVLPQAESNAGDGTPTRVRFTYFVDLPPVWTINLKERIFWDTEIVALESALIGTTADHKRIAYRNLAAMTHNMLGCLVGYIIFFSVLGEFALVLSDVDNLSAREALALLVFFPTVGVLLGGVHMVFALLLGR